jgi:hypothetical protein
MYYKLIRNNFSSVSPESNSGKAVPGKLYRVSHYYNKRTGLLVERLHYICDTLENADYLVPALIYRVTVTQSPKFRRLLPLLNQVPGRTGIRVHRGTQPEHSLGCILVSAHCEQTLTARWLSEQTAKEETRLEICNNVNFYRS